MNYVIAAGIIIVMGIVVGAWVGTRLREPETQDALAELHAATEDLKRELGNALLPTLERFAARLSEWLDRHGRDPE